MHSCVNTCPSFGMIARVHFIGLSATRNCATTQTWLECLRDWTLLSISFILGVATRAASLEAAPNWVRAQLPSSQRPLAGTAKGLAGRLACSSPAAVGLLVELLVSTFNAAMYGSTVGFFMCMWNSREVIRPVIPWPPYSHAVLISVC